MEESDSDTDDEQDDEDDEYEPDLFEWFLYELVHELIFLGGKSSWVRLHPGDATEMGVSVTPREIGEPTIPFLNVDIAFQSVKPDIEALDGRVEVGYGPMGFQYRWTHYDERLPERSLDLIQWHFLYRMCFAKPFQVRELVRGVQREP